MLVDLHLHSHFSDGELSPLEILDKAVEHGLSLFSITDHNTLITNSDIIRNVAQKNNVRYIEGIEVSCVEKQRNLSLHILGYSNRFHETKIIELMSGTIDGYNRRAEKIATKLNREFPGINLDFERIKNDSTETYVSRNTLARLLLEFVKESMSMKEVLKQYVFTEEDNSWMLSAQNAISAIHDSGGISVLAHSGRIWEQLGNLEYEQIIDTLINFGLQGIEISYPKITPEAETVLKQIATNKNLVMTGGSDWHGPTNTSDIQIGCELSKDEIDGFLEEIEKS